MCIALQREAAACTVACLTLLYINRAWLLRHQELHETQATTGIGKSVQPLQRRKVNAASTTQEVHAHCMRSGPSSGPFTTGDPVKPSTRTHTNPSKLANSTLNPSPFPVKHNLRGQDLYILVHLTKQTAVLQCLACTGRQRHCNARKPVCHVCANAG